MKRVLFISPHFPPVNAADMHRLRQILPYIRDHGWTPVVFQVKPDSCETSQDPLLLRTVPDDLEIHQTGAFNARMTRKVGLGNLGFRSWFQIRSAVSAYLKNHPVDLIFFTTTVFTSIAHGPFWKRRFGVPFVVDLQDPWRNDYYLSLPRQQRHGKFWFDYWQKSKLEAATMPDAAGMVAVSESYIDTMRDRYPMLCDRPALTLPFGILPVDVEIAHQLPEVIPRHPERTTIRYVGRGGPDMVFALTLLFRAVRSGLNSQPELFSRLAFEFIGTSYAATGKGQLSVMPVAIAEGVAHLVTEVPDRLPYFSALRHLLDADGLVVVGSDDARYTASKVYPYVLVNRPLLALFHKASSAATFLKNTNAGSVVTFDQASVSSELVATTRQYLEEMLLAPRVPEVNQDALAPFMAKAMTARLAGFMNEALAAHP